MGARLAITFLEGIITFVSPCLLPMLPIYIAFFAGGATDGTTDGPRPLARTVRSAAGFVLGFALVFCSLGALAGAAGEFLGRHERAVNVGCGAVVIVLGLNYLGVLRIPALGREVGPHANVVPHGFASSLAFGVVFALGWTPCVGTFLGAALGMAATSGHTLAGVALLLAYSLGLGLPFLMASLFIDRLEAAFGLVKGHYRVVNAACGALLVVVGILMASGTFGLWLRVLS